MRDRWRFLLLGGVLVACALWAQPSLGSVASIQTRPDGWTVDARFDRPGQPTWAGGFSPDEVEWLRVTQDSHRGAVLLEVGFFVEPDQPSVTVQLGVTPGCNTLGATLALAGEQHTEWLAEGVRYRVQEESPGPGWYYQGYWWDGQAHDLPRWSKWEQGGYYPIPGAPAQQSALSMAGMRGLMPAEELETDDLTVLAARWEHPALLAVAPPTCATVEFYPGEVHRIDLAVPPTPVAERSRRGLVTLRVPRAARLEVRVNGRVVRGVSVVRLRTQHARLTARWLVNGSWSGWRRVAVAQYPQNG